MPRRSDTLIPRMTQKNKLIIPCIANNTVCYKKVYFTYEHTSVHTKMMIIKLDVINERLKNYGEAVGNMCLLQFLTHPEDLVRFRF